MTYREICDILSDAGIFDALHEAALLLEHFCGVSLAEIPLIRDRDFLCAELERAIQRRAGRYPLQYILGEWSFCGEVYEVTPGCLIPRPDTELIVETAVKLLPEGGVFLDAGTGSGCISISILAARQDTLGTAFDISPDALDIAGRNAVKNGVSERLNFIRGNMLDNGFWESTGRYDAVISNPPYIPTREIAELEPELDFEPYSALDGGDDGLDFYRSIIKNTGLALKENGFILLEVGYGEAEQVAELAVAGGYDAEILYDIEGRGRVLLLKKGHISEKL